MTLGLGAVCRIGAKVVTVTVNSESDLGLRAVLVKLHG